MGSCHAKVVRYSKCSEIDFGTIWSVLSLSHPSPPESGTWLLWSLDYSRKGPNYKNNSHSSKFLTHGSAILVQRSRNLWYFCLLSRISSTMLGPKAMGKAHISTLYAYSSNDCNYYNSRRHVSELIWAQVFNLLKTYKRYCLRCDENIGQENAPS